MKKNGMKKKTKRAKVSPLQKLLRVAACGVIYTLIAALAGIGWVYQSLPDVIYVEQGEEVKIARLPFISVQTVSGAAAAGSTAEVGSYNTTLAIYGVIPVKTVRTVVTERPVVTVCGTPFGIKMLSEGALVVGFTDINTTSGYANPAKEAGLQIGDLLISMNGTLTQTNEDVAAAITSSEGEGILVVYVRDEQQYSTTLTPVQNEGGVYMAGLWARDSSAGVGTMTFVDEATGVFAGLGHSISDSDTGTSVSLRSGEIMDCDIIGYEAGSAGSPGELQGQFVGTGAIGSIVINSDVGIYGTTRTAFEGQAMEIGFSQEIELGAAELWTTINGDECVAYSIEIEKISYTETTRNLVIHVTDEILLAETGGIVQGMSGSPIIQNGKIIGAVTHVFVNDPTRGYGIFIETMLETAQSVE